MGNAHSTPSPYYETIGNPQPRYHLPTRFPQPWGSCISIVVLVNLLSISLYWVWVTKICKSNLALSCLRQVDFLSKPEVAHCEELLRHQAWLLLVLPESVLINDAGIFWMYLQLLSCFFNSSYVCLMANNHLISSMRFLQSLGSILTT